MASSKAAKGEQLVLYLFSDSIEVRTDNGSGSVVSGFNRPVGKAGTVPGYHLLDLICNA